jgi:quercetin dioxygenase-like cupin family protein
MSLPPAMRAALLAAVASVPVVCGSAAWGAEPRESVSPVFQAALPRGPDHTFTAVVVQLPPGARAAPHRHGHAFVFAYVLEGQVRSQLEGGRAQTYSAGQSWSEPPGAHHLLTENPSAAEPAKMLVVFISRPGDALKTDDMKDKR